MKLFLFYFSGSFWPSWIRIHNDCHTVPDPTGSGSTALPESCLAGGPWSSRLLPPAGPWTTQKSRLPQWTWSRHYFPSSSVKSIFDNYSNGKKGRVWKSFTKYSFATSNKSPAFWFDGRTSTMCEGRMLIYDQLIIYLWAWCQIWMDKGLYEYLYF